MHEITTVESTDTEITRECACGWVTIGTIPEPDFHTPLADREAKHLEEAAKIDDQTVWDEIPYRHSYQLHLRRRLRDQTPNQVVVTAIWMGGSREVLNWPWNSKGLAYAQSWCNQMAYEKNPVVWATTGFPVERDSLRVHADPI